MPKRLTSIRLSEITDRQLAELASATGLNTSELITIAIDRMCRQEIGGTQTLVDIQTAPPGGIVSGQENNMRHSERVALRRIAGLTEEEIRRIEIAAERYEEALRPDGAREYVAETAEYSRRALIGRKTLRKLIVE